MYTLIICWVIVIVISSVWLVWLEYCLQREWMKMKKGYVHRWSDFWGSLVIGAGVGVFIGGIVGVIIGGLVGHFTGQYHTVSREIVVLQDGKSSGGSFFLGSGTFEDKPSFFYYEKQGEYVSYKSIEAKKVRVLENNLTPSITCVVKTSSNWGLDAGKESDCVFNIPKGSIKSVFTLPGEK